MVAEISHYEKLIDGRSYDWWTKDEWKVVLTELEITKNSLLTLGFASHFVGHKFNLHDGAIDTLLNQMIKSVGNGLIVRHPHTDMPYIPTETRSYYELVRADELDNWYESQGVEYRIQNNFNNTKIDRPEPQQRFQENEILRVIEELGFNATSLPLWEAGKRGVKAQVREELKFSSNVFNKAWARLREEGNIKE